ncbi:MAG: hypothetical protein LQ351_006374 [Letrouitia transgressa]|nr:MAG: hypothetical protein LQ351_006374 [Letrouitia transgressa]
MHPLRLLALSGFALPFLVGAAPFPEKHAIGETAEPAWSWGRGLPGKRTVVEKRDVEETAWGWGRGSPGEEKVVEKRNVEKTVEPAGRWGYGPPGKEKAKGKRSVEETAKSA